MNKVRHAFFKFIQTRQKTIRNIEFID